MRINNLDFEPSYYHSLNILSYPLLTCNILEYSLLVELVQPPTSYQRRLKTSRHRKIAAKVFQMRVDRVRVGAVSSTGLWWLGHVSCQLAEQPFCIFTNAAIVVILALFAALFMLLTPQLLLYQLGHCQYCCNCRPCNVVNNNLLLS